MEVTKVSIHRSKVSKLKDEVSGILGVVCEEGENVQTGQVLWEALLGENSRRSDVRSGSDMQIQKGLRDTNNKTDVFRRDGGGRGHVTSTVVFAVSTPLICSAKEHFGYLEMWLFWFFSLGVGRGYSSNQKNSSI